MSDLHVVRIVVLEPRNPDSIENDPDGPFINSEFLEQVETGIFGPFSCDEEAEQFVLDRQEMAEGSKQKVRYQIIPLEAPPGREHRNGLS